MLEQVSYHSQRIYGFEASLTALPASSPKSLSAGPHHVEERIKYVNVPQVKYVKIPKVHIVEVPSFFPQ